MDWHYGRSTTAVITIIILIVLGLLALAGLAVALLAKAPDPEARRNSYDTDPDARLVGWGVFALFGVIFVVVCLFQSVKIVGANEVGVPVTFGKVSHPIQSGFHLVKPWTDVETLPTRPRTFTVDAKVRTSESGSVGVRLSGRWATDRDHASDLYQQVRTGDEDQIQAEIIGPNLVSAAGAYMGGLTNFDAVSGSKWEANANGIEAIAVRYLTRYGIRVDTVQVRQVTPDKATEQAIATFSSQQRATNIALEAQKTAAAEAGRRKIEADGLKVAAAESASIDAEQLQSLCLQAAERIMNRNNDKGIPTYVLPCQTGGTAVIAQGK